ncbi:MAG: hypothetical protein ACK58Q_04775 [Chitinophagales bacterium]|jgi:hypothetical protein
MNDEIVTKVRLDIDGLKADIVEAKKEGNQLVADLEKKDIKVKVTPVVDQRNVESSFSRLKENVSSKFSEITNGISDQLKGVGASATAAFNTLKAAGVSSFRAIGSAIAASGIGLLPIALGIIASNWDKITSAISGTTKEMESFGEAAKGIEKLQENIIKVGNGFELAKKGVLSKEEALKKYNDTLGKTYGTFTDYNDAESFFIKSTPLMIEAAIARQSADILIKKAAEKNIELLTKREQKEASLLERLAFGEKFAKTRLADKKIALVQELGVDQVRINKLTENAYKLEENLKKIAKESGAKFGKDKDYSDSVNTGTEDLKEKKANHKKYIEDKKKQDIDYSKSVYTSTENQVSDPEKFQEITDIIKKAEDDKADSLLSSYDRDLKAIEENYGAKILFAEEYGLSTAAIEQEMFDKIDELNKNKAKQDEENTAQILKNQNSIVTGTENQISTLDDLLKKQKEAFDQLLEFAANGVLISIGLNPQDVARLSESIKGIVDKIRNDQPIDAGEIAEASANAYFAVSNAIAANDAQKRQEELAALQVQQEEELRLAGDNEQKKDVIRQKYILKEKEVKRKQAEADKKKAIMDATIKTAVAVISAISQSPLTLGMPWAAIVAALGAAEIAMIAATPIPKFAKGVVSFDGKGGLVKGEGTGTSDSNLAYLSRGESVIPAEPTSANLGLINELVNGDVDSYINRHYVMPALQAKESKASEMYRHSKIEAENNLIARVSSHTLKSIDRRLIETNQSIKGLAKKDYSW